MTTLSDTMKTTDSLITAILVRGKNPNRAGWGQNGKQ